MNYHLEENGEKEAKYKKAMIIATQKQAMVGFTQAGSKWWPLVVVYRMIAM